MHHTARAPKEVREAFDIRCFVLPNGTGNALIDLSAVEWISPLGVVALLARCLMATTEGVQIVVKLPSNQRARTYLSRIGFYAALRQQGVNIYEEGFGLDNAYEVRACLPVTRVTGEIEMERASNSLFEALRASGAPAELLMVSYDVLAELTNNAREHGSPCYVVAQTHTGRTSGTPGVHIAIADFGPGFRTTLKAYTPRSETEAIIKAFKDRVSTTGDPLRGLGLGWVLSHVDRYPGATLQIVSRNGLVTRRDGSFARYRGGDCRGVFASAYFPFLRH